VSAVRKIAGDKSRVAVRTPNRMRDDERRPMRGRQIIDRANQRRHEVHDEAKSVHAIHELGAFTHRLVFVGVADRREVEAGARDERREVRIAGDGDVVPTRAQRPTDGDEWQHIASRPDRQEQRVHGRG
jgi:hypothetical protein